MKKITTRGIIHELLKNPSKKGRRQCDPAWVVKGQKFIEHVLKVMEDAGKKQPTWVYIVSQGRWVKIKPPRKTMLMRKEGEK